MTKRLLAHSARTPDAGPQDYAAHVAGVRVRAQANATAVARYMRDGKDFAGIVDDGAQFHDLGKLDPDIQASLQCGRGARLKWDHVDAGVAHLMNCGAKPSAWIVSAHHRPGLHSLPEQQVNGRYLRGRRGDDIPPEYHLAQIDRTNRFLRGMLDDHAAAVGASTPQRRRSMHGLALRMALSCLVDADHADTACFDSGAEPATGAPTRWPERLSALDAYVASLEDRGGERNRLRREFYDACRHGGPQAALACCEGPVGVGKTTAVTAFLLRRAMESDARRLFVVAPYTSILSQTAERLRKALVLPGEDPGAIVAEHHHRADFSDISSRELATLWTAPVVLTTAVQFFETLAANEPGRLRKLHQLPGAVVFIDEAHAALPTRLWPQNWRWIRQLAEEWSCSFVMASGSLARFWENEDIVGNARAILPELTPPRLAEPLRSLETRRIAYESIGRLDSLDSLIDAVMATPGPRLVILNTVQNAAVLALRMKEAAHGVEHLSSALCPRDRDAALARIVARLQSYDDGDWTLVATSLVEAGVELSFKAAFRERFSVASLIQVGGRVNRHAVDERRFVYDFSLSGNPDITKNPAARIPAYVVEKLFGDRAFEGTIRAADLVTKAMAMELRRANPAEKVVHEKLVEKEAARDYPEVARLGRVIEADTRLVVIDPDLRDRILRRGPVAGRDLLAGSVQLWATRIDALGLELIAGCAEIFWWPHRYDPNFLGYMAGALRLREIATGQAFIV